jgi:hypothetical protein
MMMLTWTEAGAHLSASWGCTHGRRPVGKRDHHLSTNMPSMRESQGATEAREAMLAVGELPGQKHRVPAISNQEPKRLRQWIAAIRKQANLSER